MTASLQTRELSAAARATLFLVELYQRWISPALPRRCRYYPTCSAYAVEALRTHGAFKGMLLAIWRLLRCNPLARGGVDHVPDSGAWRYRLPPDVPRFAADPDAKPDDGPEPRQAPQAL
ncbi:membrane protein insertion efficiency factor YidD [Actinomyces sp.]|uniref:membrane protein insertion efficiency factor YidD n=1 Tax=Actinomyces sp. TaxID=29317 RepID=UPI0026DC72C9|nr:membrane protein insertion efficiency factor YidD [Actinomyces sp.]MDO4900739.1 membrane protein insertion efficiency factor YidD [Actinomyces sp.]